MKGKGIPAWMIKDDPASVERCKWNNNDRQIVFQDYIDCVV